MTKTGPVKSIDNTGPSPSHCQNMTTCLLLISFDVFSCVHTRFQPSLSLRSHFWMSTPVSDTCHPFSSCIAHFWPFWLSSSIWTCRHILLTTLEWLNIFLTTHTHFWAPPPIFKLNRSFSTNFTLFDYFHLFLTVFTLFLIDFTRSQSLLFIFRPFLVNFDCSCLNLSVTTYFFNQFYLFLTVFDQF